MILKLNCRYARRQGAYSEPFSSAVVGHTQRELRQVGILHVESQVIPDIDNLVTGRPGVLILVVANLVNTGQRDLSDEASGRS